MNAVARAPRATITLLLIVVMALVFLWIFLSGTLRVRRGTHDRAAESTGRADVSGPPIDRRAFIRGGMLAALGAFAAQMGGASLAFLWPNLKGGFGSAINAGPVADIKSQIAQNNQPFYFGAGRFWIVPYKGSGTNTIYAGLITDGLMALYQKCPHLGCRVPFCATSQWFECPCHGSKYNEAGEYQLGPAPTGMFRFKLTVENGNAIVDTSSIIPGPPRGTNTIHQPPNGPFCV